jgi:hypothetical protein
MNQKSFVLAAILAATALWVIATPLAYTDSTTNKVITNNQQGDASGQSKNNYELLGLLLLIHCLASL